MNVRQRRKLFAGAGLVSMLLGAFMVVMPAGAGAEHTSPEPTVARGNQACPSGTVDFKIDPPDLSGDSTVTVTRDVVLPSDTEPTSVTITYRPYVHDGVRHFEWTSSEPIVRVVVKQGPDSAIFTYDPPAEDGDVYVALMEGTSASPLGTSHISFCIGDTPTPPPATGSISIDKVVTGAGAPTTDPAYGFTVSCDLNGSPVTLDATESTFTLTKDQTAKVISGLPVGTTCTVTEPGDQDNGATTTSYTVGTGTPSATPSAATVVADTVTPVVVTNDFPATSPRTGGISVDKIVTGGGAPAATTAFDFTVDCGDEDLNGEATGTDASFSLTATDAPWTFANLPTGTQCTVVETNDQGATTTTYSVQGGQVTVADGGTSAVVVTNDFPAQIPPPPTPTPTFSVDLEKLNDANGDGAFNTFESAPAAGRDVDFQITIENTGTGALTLATLTDSFDREVVDLLEDVDLDCLRDGSAVTLAVGSVLPVGSVTTCTFTLADYSPAGGEALINTVSVDSVETGPASDTSTVTTPEVLPDVVVPTPTPPAATPTPLPTPQVQGAVVTRQLPRTGNESGNLAAFGAGLLAMGAAMVLASRMRFRRVD